MQGEIRPLARDARIFSNREYAFRPYPSVWDGHSFLFSPIESTRAAVREAGVVYVLTPRPDRNPRGSLERALTDQGFRLVALPEFEMFPGLANTVSVFQKEVQAGERIEFGLWGVLIGRAADAGTSMFCPLTGVGTSISLWSARTARFGCSTAPAMALERAFRATRVVLAGAAWTSGPPSPAAAARSALIPVSP